MVNDLNDTHHRKPKTALSASKALDNLSDNQTNLINNSTGITSPPHFYTKRPNKPQMSKFKLFPKRHHFSHPKTTPKTSTLPKYSNNDTHPNDNLAVLHDTLVNTRVTSKTDTPIKLYSRVNYPFLPPIC